MGRDLYVGVWRSPVAHLHGVQAFTLILSFNSFLE